MTGHTEPCGSERYRNSEVEEPQLSNFVLRLRFRDRELGDDHRVLGDIFRLGVRTRDPRSVDLVRALDHKLTAFPQWRHSAHTLRNENVRHQPERVELLIMKCSAAPVPRHHGADRLIAPNQGKK